MSSGMPLAESRARQIARSEYLPALEMSRSSKITKGGVVLHYLLSIVFVIASAFTGFVQN
jgi:hypothetical protein